MKKLNLNSKLKQWNLDWWGVRCPYSRKLKQITYTELIALVHLSQNSWWANIPNEQKMETKWIFIQISIASASIHSLSYDLDDVSFYLGVNSQVFVLITIIFVAYPFHARIFMHIRKWGIWISWFVALKIFFSLVHQMKYSLMTISNYKTLIWFVCGCCCYSIDTHMVFSDATYFKIIELWKFRLNKLIESFTITVTILNWIEVN